MVELSILRSYPLLINGAVTTITITFTSIFCAILFGCILVMGRLSSVRLLRYITHFYIETFRSLPLVMVLIGFYLVIPGILRTLFNVSGDIRLHAAIMAFSLFESAYFAEILRSGINAVAKNQFQAARALGFTTIQTYRLIILPQAIKNTFPALLTQCVILFQDVALVYVIGLPDFFGMAVKIGARDGEIVEAILFASVIYFIICFILQRIVNRFKQSQSLYEVK